MSNSTRQKELSMIFDRLLLEQHVRPSDPYLAAWWETLKGKQDNRFMRILRYIWTHF